MNRSNWAIMAALLLHTVFLGLAKWGSEQLPLAHRAAGPILINLESAPSQAQRLAMSPKDSSPLQKAPSDARYFSDRNRRVIRESQATNGGVTDLSQLQSPSLQKQLSLTDKGGDGDVPFVGRAQPGSQAQRLNDPSLPSGAENLLNTVESIHYSFYSRIYGSLAPVWQSMVRNSRPHRPLSPGNYTVVADLVLDSKGNLIGIEFHERSPVKQFNDAVIASANRVRKFPNPPHDLIAGKSEFRTLWSFTVNVGENSFIDFAPPRRID